MLAAVKNLLTDIKIYVNDIRVGFNNLYDKLLPMLDKYYNLLFNINSSFNDLLNDYYIPEWSGDLKYGWENFWNSFQNNSFDVVLKNTLLEVHQQIEDLTNPISENNKAEYDANIEKIKTDTVIGSAYDVKDGINNLYNNVANANATAVISVNTLPVSFFGMSFPAHTINIDFSWFAPYREFTLSLWRFILWTGYIFLLFKRIPDIINGAGMITDTVTNANMTEGSESILHSITVGDDGSILSDIESKTSRDGNVTNRVTIRHDVSGNSTELRR